jgi:hypothetical protein
MKGFEMANEKAEGIFFRENDTEKVGFPTARTKITNQRFGFMDCYGSRVTVEFNGSAVKLYSEEQGKWQEEKGEATIYFPTLEHFVTFCARAAEFAARDEEWPKAHAAALAMEASRRIEEKQDAGVIKFRAGQNKAVNPAADSGMPWHLLNDAQRKEWRRKYEAAKRDIQ